jgi:hypothetical protein
MYLTVNHKKRVTESLMIKNINSLKINCDSFTYASCMVCVYNVHCTYIYSSKDGVNVWEPDDEMDEEIQAAFEQFLQMSSNHSKVTNPSDSKCNG